jgi:4-hydroxy-2-oxoglutarate aldolase
MHRPASDVEERGKSEVIDLSGVLIPAATPFQAGSGELDLPALEGNLRKWAAHEVQGIVMAGTTGEAVLLEEAERLALVAAGREVLPKGILIIAGTGLESTRATIRLTRAVADVGADAVLVQPPAYYKGAMTPEVLREHYRAVADASPVPVIIYQAPLKVSTLDFPTGLVSELSTHENVVGIKDSRGKLGLVGELVSQCPEGFQVLVGSGAFLYPALEVGAVGGIVAVANLAPGESVALFHAFKAGRSAEAGRLQEQIGPVHNEIIGAIGVPGVKVALELLGYRAGDPRPPLRALPEEGREKVREILARKKLLS